MALPALRPLSVGEILDVSFQLYRRHFAALATVALVCSGFPVLLSLFIEASGGMLQHLWLTGAYYVIFVVLSAIATAATVFIVSESYLGRPLTAGEALSRATPFLWRVIACSILLGMLVMVGFFLFVIPGFILVCGLILSFPALVLEPGTTASAALSRSWALTRGARWRIFGMLVTLFLLLYIPIVALTALAALALPSAPSGAAMTGGLVGVILAGVVQLFLYPLFYCVLTVVYYDLRVRKEGFDLEVLAQTLQTA
ncbi:MAG TPA: glycerophosphoryl diester phosphodiesterase membrane domain-containing protein [Gemmatimonadales bacterium]|nr:glycerophosphoryl diester phosphodiesterase membrane domain-containing protein [Gemmatimonadales bacterium]